MELVQCIFENLSTKVDSLDLNTMSWSSLGAMSTHRHGLGVVVLEGPLYAVGGHDGNENDK